MAIAQPVGDLTVAYLKRCGYTAAEINTWTNETRLLHDLGLCGDDILDEFAVLSGEFGVDLAELNLERYFPSERSGDAFIIAIRRPLRAVGLGRVVRKVLLKYASVTLGMLETTIARKRWVTAE